MQHGYRIIPGGKPHPRPRVRSIRGHDMTAKHWALRRREEDVLRSMARYQQEVGVEPTCEQIAKDVGISVTRVYQVRAMLRYKGYLEKRK